MTVQENKVSLSHQRAELITHLTRALSPEVRIDIQGKLSVINAKLKALNTMQAAQLKTLADQRRIAGRAEAQANAARTGARIHDVSEPDAANESDEDLDPAATLDAWIDAVLLRHDVDFTRSPTGEITFSPPLEQVTVLKILVAGIYALSRGEELPELPSAVPRPKKASKSKKR